MLLAALLAFASPPADWPEFRGPAGTGHYSGPPLPRDWGPNKNQLWAAPVPGRGWSSPVLVGGKLVLTTAVEGSDGVSLRALAFDFDTGKSLWDVELFRPPAGQTEQIHKKNTLASPTPASDGKLVVCHFGHMGTACLTLDGAVKWKTNELVYKPVHGGGASPVLADGVVCLPCDGGDLAFVAGLDLGTGALRWKTDRNTKASKTFSFATPQLLTDRTGRRVLVSPGSDFCMGYDPATGAELWRCRYPGGGFSLIPRPVEAQDKVFVCTGYGGQRVIGLDPAATGEVKPSFDWKVKMYAPNTPTPLVVGDELYLVADMGYLSCVDVKSGKTHYTERLAGKGYSASPIFSDGHLWLTSEEGVGQVIAAGPEFREVGKTELGEKTFSTFLPAAGSLVVRTDGKLYRFGAAAAR